MKHSLAVLKTSLFAAGLALFAGCSSVPLDDAGEYQAVNEVGKFRMLVNADSARTVAATRAVFADMRLKEVASDVQRFQADLTGETELNEKVRVYIREINSRQSELQIRVKWVGHQDYSRLMWERIEAKIAAGQ